MIKLITFSSIIILFNLMLYTQISRKAAENEFKTSKTPKFTTNGVACDQKSYCFTCIVDSVPRDSLGRNLGYRCKPCNMEILCPAGIARQHDEKSGEIIDVCIKCGRKLEKFSYYLNNKMLKGYKTFPADAIVRRSVPMNATMDVPEWVFWAKPGDIAEVKANVSPCIGNKELNFLVVVLNSESCFSQ
ncbi:MAG: hypothetical protein ACW963_04750 [Candidatus Sifarchaeia archaeon]